MRSTRFARFACSQSLVCERLRLLVLFILVVLGYYGSEVKYLKVTIVVIWGNVMRQYILTEREREEIAKYLKGKKVTHLISVLRLRAKRYLESLKEDIRLLEQVIEK